MDNRFPIVLPVAAILVTQLVPGCFRIALESSFKDWIDWNPNERGIRKKMNIQFKKMKIIKLSNTKLLYLSNY